MQARCPVVALFAITLVPQVTHLPRLRSLYCAFLVLSDSVLSLAICTITGCPTSAASGHGKLRTRWQVIYHPLRTWVDLKTRPRMSDLSPTARTGLHSSIQHDSVGIDCILSVCLNTAFQGRWHRHALSVPLTYAVSYFPAFSLCVSAGLHAFGSEE